MDLQEHAATQRGVTEEFCTSMQPLRGGFYNGFSDLQRLLRPRNEMGGRYRNHWPTSFR